MSTGYIPDDRLKVAVDGRLGNVGLMSGSLDAIERQDALAAIEDWLKTNYPGRYFVPNFGQEKAILPLKTINPDDDEIRIGVLLVVMVLARRPLW